MSGPWRSYGHAYGEDAKPRLVTRNDDVLAANHELPAPIEADLQGFADDGVGRRSWRLA
jgi:hypothetical protein